MSGAAPRQAWGGVAGFCYAFAVLKIEKPVNQSISRLFEYSRGESNPNLKNRNLQFYPLNYGGSLGVQI